MRANILLSCAADRLCMTQKQPPASLLLVARWVAANQKNAPANPPAPANVGASAPLHPVDDVTDGKLVDGAHSRPDSKPIAYLRDQEHRVLGRFVAHPLGQVGASLARWSQYSGSLTSGAMGMERPFSDHTP